MFHIGEKLWLVGSLIPITKTIFFLIKGKLNPKKVSNFHFTGMNSVGKKIVAVNLRSLLSGIFDIKPYLPPFCVK